MSQPRDFIDHSPVDATTSHSAQVVPGWRLNFAAGAIPFTAGLITFVTTQLGVARPDAPWPTGLSSLGFTFNRLAAAGNGAQQWAELTGSVGGVNVAAAAVAVSVVARFGLRAGQRWAWWFLAFCLLWIGLHDAFAATRFFAATGQPIIVMPYSYVALMLAGLIRSRKAIFAPQVRN
ncbi:hypothetical protein BJP76_17055 [Mycobacterium avium subsp. hominissuis]|uniref:hypothetical protein n=1 Tax=Mycobacterium TaxID=1763 RepID=UPI00111C43C4|nr:MULTISPECIES: hypothetical protein [Mycobacterium]